MLGIDARYYYHIFTWLVALLSFFVFSRYSSYSQSRLEKSGNGLSPGVFLLALFLVLFIGNRPISGKYFVDMSLYYHTWSLYIGSNYQITWNTTNKVFDNLLNSMASSGVSVYTFFVLIAAIYFVGIAWACSSLFPRDKMAAFLVYLGAFSTFQYGVNGIKAGAAASLFLMALAMYTKQKKLWTMVFLFLSWGFHHSMILPVVAFVVCVFVKDPKWYFALWILSFFMAMFHITFVQTLFAGFVDEEGAEYLMGYEDHIRHDMLGGFRIDFIAYSAAPVVIGWIAVFKKQIVSREYEFLLNLYILINSVWMLCMYAEFTNRIAYLSWLMLPIVLIYPLLNEDWGSGQYKTFQWVALGHLAFTLFLSYVYYLI